MGRAPSLLSIVRVTSARPRAGRPDVPAKTTSSILPPRSGLTPCSPMTQENASTTLDLPDPFGPTTQVIPGSNRIDVADANDLKPRRVRVLRYTRAILPGISSRILPPWRGCLVLPHPTARYRQRSGLRFRLGGVGADLGRFVASQRISRRTVLAAGLGAGALGAVA